jgi:hypothetical protein
VVQMTAIGPLGNGINVQVDKYPDYCPMCHRAIVVMELGVAAILISSEKAQVLEKVFRCPNDLCRRLFIGRFFKATGTDALFVLGETFPAELVDPQFSDTILGVSKDYCEIYKQAHRAELTKLDLVAGPGYRKALEFLVKDYLLQQYTDVKDQEAIKTNQLGWCIGKYVTNENVKTIAKRAAWLGNDETHFVRKWGDKDIQDLKRLIDLTVRWIEMEALTKESIAEMPEP